MHASVMHAQLSYFQLLKEQYCGFAMVLRAKGCSSQELHG